MFRILGSRFDVLGLEIVVNGSKSEIWGSTVSRFGI